MTRLAALAGAALCVVAAVFGWQRTDSPSTSSATASAASVDVDGRPGGSIDGAVVFRLKGCAGCHARAGSTPMLPFGYPDLTDAADWAGTRRPGLSADAYLRESVREPSAFLSPAFRGSAPSPMPTLTLTDHEVDALVTFLLRRE